MATDPTSDLYTCSRVIIPSGITLDAAIASLANRRHDQGAELVTATTVNGEVYLVFKRAESGNTV
jgi:hypothetical protein